MCFITFWVRDIFCSTTLPLVYVIQEVDSNVRPFMPYLYTMMDSTKEKIAAVYNGNKRKYIPYWKLVDHRWCDIIRVVNGDRKPNLKFCFLGGFPRHFRGRVRVYFIKPNWISIRIRILWQVNPKTRNATQNLYNRFEKAIWLV